MNNLKRSYGLAQIPLMIGLLIMAIAVPAVTKLVQQSQENRGKAACTSSGVASCSSCCAVASNIAANMCNCKASTTTTTAKASPVPTSKTGTSVVNPTKVPTKKPATAAPTKKPSCAAGNTGAMCTSSKGDTCQIHRNSDCSTSCTDNCSMFTGNGGSCKAGTTGGVCYCSGGAKGTLEQDSSCKGYCNCGGLKEEVGGKPTPTVAKPTAAPTRKYTKTGNCSSLKCTGLNEMIYVIGGSTCGCAVTNTKIDSKNCGQIGHNCGIGWSCVDSKCVKDVSPVTPTLKLTVTPIPTGNVGLCRDLVCDSGDILRTYGSSATMCYCEKKICGGAKQSCCADNSLGVAGQKYSCDSGYLCVNGKCEFITDCTFPGGKKLNNGETWCTEIMNGIFGSFKCNYGVIEQKYVDGCGTDVVTGGTCNSIKKCGTGLVCVGGYCLAPSPTPINNGTCNSLKSCPVGNVCIGGYCLIPTPTPTGGTCNTIKRCGTGLVCVGGYCVAPSPTPINNGTCNSLKSCPVGNVCIGGYCLIPTPAFATCTVGSAPVCNVDGIRVMSCNNSGVLVVKENCSSSLGVGGACANGVCKRPGSQGSTCTEAELNKYKCDNGFSMQCTKTADVSRVVFYMWAKNGAYCEGGCDSSTGRCKPIPTVSAGCDCVGGRWTGAGCDTVYQANQPCGQQCRCARTCSTSSNCYWSTSSDSNPVCNNSYCSKIATPTPKKGYKCYPDGECDITYGGQYSTMDECSSACLKTVTPTAIPDWWLTPTLVQNNNSCFCYSSCSGSNCQMMPNTTSTSSGFVKCPGKCGEEVCRNVNQSCYDSKGRVNCCSGLRCNSSGMCVRDATSTVAPTVNPRTTPGVTSTNPPPYVTGGSNNPTDRPDYFPTDRPGNNPTDRPGNEPTDRPGNPTNRPTNNPSVCTECPRDFKCYTDGNEYRWFVTGYVMDGFTAVTEANTGCGGVVKPTFLGKAKGDATCDGENNMDDYSLWYKEFQDGDGTTISKTWHADFTGPNGVCDGKVNMEDYSLWYKYFNDLNGNN